MTKDFIEDLQQALLAEGYEYFICISKDWNKGGECFSELNNLSSDFKFPAGRVISKKESLLELFDASLTDTLEEQK